MDTETIHFLDLTTSRGRKKIPTKSISLIYRPGKSYNVTFSREETEFVTSEGMTHYLVGYKELTGEIIFVFSKKEEQNSKPIRISNHGKIGYGNIVIASKLMCDLIIKAFNLNKGDRKTKYFQISNNLSLSPETIIFKITNPL